MHASEPDVRQVERLAAAAGCAVDYVIRPAGVPKVSDQFIAVLEFGELFPRKAPKPLINLAPMWRAASDAP